MSKILIVVPCPTCNYNVSKDNKILYDGMFLICHNCGYGWYCNLPLAGSGKTANNNNTSSINHKHNELNNSNPNNANHATGNHSHKSTPTTASNHAGSSNYKANTSNIPHSKTIPNNSLPNQPADYKAASIKKANNNSNIPSNYQADAKQGSNNNKVSGSNLEQYKGKNSNTEVSEAAKNKLANYSNNIAESSNKYLGLTENNNANNTNQQSLQKYLNTSPAANVNNKNTHGKAPEFNHNTTSSQADSKGNKIISPVNKLSNNVLEKETLNKSNANPLASTSTHTNAPLANKETKVEPTNNPFDTKTTETQEATPYKPKPATATNINQANLVNKPSQANNASTSTAVPNNAKNKAVSPLVNNGFNNINTSKINNTSNSNANTPIEANNKQLTSNAFNNQNYHISPSTNGAKVNTAFNSAKNNNNISNANNQELHKPNASFTPAGVNQSKIINSPPIVAHNSELAAGNSQTKAEKTLAINPNVNHNSLPSENITNPKPVLNNNSMANSIHSNKIDLPKKTITDIPTANVTNTEANRANFAQLLNTNKPNLVNNLANAFNNLTITSSKKNISLNNNFELTAATLAGKGLNNSVNNNVNKFTADTFNTAEHTNMNFSAANLLKDEYNKHYNFNKEPKVKEPLSEQFNNLLSAGNDVLLSAKEGLVVLRSSIIKTLIHPDKLLRLIAYLILIGSALSVLVYAVHLKNLKLKDTHIQNTNFNNPKVSGSDSYKVEDKNNLSSSSILQLNKIETNKLSKGTADIVKDNEKTIAFQKSQDANLELQALKNNPDLAAPEATANSASKLAGTFDSLLLKTRQFKQNFYSKVKIHTLDSGWVKDSSNNRLFTTATSIENHDRSNSYLIKSVEVVFTNIKGSVVGKRQIIVNQLINNLSQVNIQVNVKDIPFDTYKSYVFINDKSKIN